MADPLRRKGGIAIAGSGPAALMAADVLAAAGHQVQIFEKRKALGRKLLIAGSSGLNITNSLPHDEFIAAYEGGPPGFWDRLLRGFSPQDWISFVERDLGVPTFEGTSRRYFVEDMKASKLLQAWLKRLQDRGVTIHTGHELTDFSGGDPAGLTFQTASGTKKISCDAALLALGGASYETPGTELIWPSFFLAKKIGFTPFTPSNAGYQVAWSPELIKEAEGLPLKKIELTTSRGRRMGELVITRYGLEGTPIYALGRAGPASLDLKPDLTEAQIITKCEVVRENLSPMRRVKKRLSLGPAALALLFHLTTERERSDLKLLAHCIKSLGFELEGPQPLSESISSAGGVGLGELDENFMIKSHPRIFLAGEMLDWDVCTGGYLIQGAVSQGFVAGHGILKLLSRLEAK